MTSLRKTVCDVAEKGYYVTKVSITKVILDSVRDNECFVKLGL